MAPHEAETKWKPDDLQLAKLERSRMKILSVFFEAPAEGLGLVKITDQTGLSKKTVWKNLDRMRNEKFVDYNLKTRKYQITREGINEYIRLIHEEEHRKMEKKVVIPLEIDSKIEFQGSGMVSIDGPILPKDEEKEFKSDLEREWMRMMETYNPFKRAKEVHVTLHFKPNKGEEKEE